MPTITPKIIPADTETEVVITSGPEEPSFDPEQDYTIQLFDMETGTFATPAAPPLPLRPQSGVLRFRQFFAGEQEHRLLLSADGEEPPARLHVYSVQPDLLARRPFKGDLHQHSHCSDGREAPAAVAAHNRRIGMDFAALTDHRLYAPSLEAIEAFAEVPLDLRLYPGEEVHPPDNPVHFVNFGGEYSVHALFDQPRYMKEVDALLASLPDVPEGLNPYVYASSLWTLQAIQEAHGIAIFCHPYWVWGETYNVQEPLTARLFRDQPFSAYELLSGYWAYETESNALQVARYYHEVAQGHLLPIVGVSDGHGIERGLHGWYYTLVLAPSPELEDLREAIGNHFSVAVEQVPGMPAPRPYGPFRLVKYTSFLLREVLPAHDALCMEEGEWMAEHLRGEPQAANHLAHAQGRTHELYDRLWASSPQ
ncbi:MAG: hypothetical protein GX100_10065 [candidate division WS1 bacterium]|nr:hypothetical protein [candidate division WS1 bacterium]